MDLSEVWPRVRSFLGTVHDLQREPAATGAGRAAYDPADLHVDLWYLRAVHLAEHVPLLHDDHGRDRERTIDKPCKNCGYKMTECPHCKHAVDKKDPDYQPESFLMRQVSKAPKKGKVVIGKPSPED